MEHGAVDEYAHLVCTEVEQDLKAVDGAGGRYWRRGYWELQL